MKTRRLKSPWPFLYSCTDKGVVQNLPPAAKKPKRQRLRRVPPAALWTQEALL